MKQMINGLMNTWYNFCKFCIALFIRSMIFLIGLVLACSFILVCLMPILIVLFMIRAW